MDFQKISVHLQHNYKYNKQMTLEEYKNIDWHRGNSVRLNNGKEYLVKKVKHNYLLLWTDEYEKHFIVDYRIIECRTSDYIDDTPKHSDETQKEPAPSAAATPAPEAPAAEAPTATPRADENAPSADAPVKRKRKRIIISKPVAERIKIL